MSNSITMAIKASQIRQNIPLENAEQVVVKTLKPIAEEDKE